MGKALFCGAIVLALTISVERAAAQADRPHDLWDPATARWQPSGRGLESATVFGDTSQPGSYTIAFRLAPGAWIPPHTHPRAKQVTVLTGALLMGYGRTLDSTAVHTVSAGRIAIVAPNTAHYEGARELTIVLFSGDGPLVTSWIR